MKRRGLIRGSTSCPRRGPGGIYHVPKMCSKDFPRMDVAHVRYARYYNSRALVARLFGAFVPLLSTP